MEDMLIIILLGFFEGLILWIYIHVWKIQRKVDRLLKAIDKAFCIAGNEIGRLEEEKNPSAQAEIERLYLCNTLFNILGKAIHDLK